ncbi:hypothetical protein [Nitrososphaera viennensis]|uniref:Uncharacterized protein n=1 Tax=Nitrososphaera viennensis TaxID=1034015 RepID=A0A977NLM0_9ARCH|nr:hypothetical protein [Nitrososphaera viennensis]UVS68582.1 hypothetical protein NWT39_11815 [Nitrososphaera viennensis]
MGILKKREEDKQEKQKAVERFYALLKALMDELFEHAQKSRHVKMPKNVSFGLIYDQRDNILFTGSDSKTGKKMYLYNVRVIGKMFEEKREQMLADQTTQTLFSWIADVCSIYISPFVYEYVVNVQHRGEGTAERTTRQIVRSFLDKLTSEPELKYVLDTIRDDSQKKEGEEKADQK